MIFNLIYLGRLCTTNVQILEILLSKFENLPPHLHPLPPLGGEDEGEGGRWILVAALPRCNLCGESLFIGIILDERK